MHLITHFIRPNLIVITVSCFRMDPAAIADNLVENATTKEVVSFKQLWIDQTCVIIFLRR